MVKNLEEAIRQAGSPVKLLWESKSPPAIVPRVVQEFTNWRDEQLAWRRTAVLFDQCALVQVQGAPREFGRVLAGAAADLQHVAGRRIQIFRYRSPDGLMVAPKGRAFEPAVGRCRLTEVAEIGDKFRHCCSRIDG